MGQHFYAIDILMSLGCTLLALHPAQKPLNRYILSSISLTRVVAIAEQASKQSDTEEIETILRSTEISKYEMLAQGELLKYLPEQPIPTQALPPGQTPQNVLVADTSQFKNLKDLLETGKGIFLMASTGCGKSSLVKFFCGELGNIESLVVCDPHWKGDQSYGVTPHFNYNDIFDQLQNALDELDSRKELARVGKEDFPYKVYVFDEWPSILQYANLEDKSILKLCKRALIRLGSECRKYKMLTIFCSQSSNVASAGLEGQGDFLNNFSCIRIGRNAIKYAKRNSLKEELELLKQQAYPCLVDDDVYYHATHGHYPEFKDKQPPANIKPFTIGKPEQTQPDLEVTGNNIIVTDSGRFDLNKEGVSEGVEVLDYGVVTPHQHSDVNTLEALYNNVSEKVTPITLIPDGWVTPSPITPELAGETRGVLTNLITHKCNKEETIKLVFGVSKGTSKKYKAASEWFDKIKSEIM